MAKLTLRAESSCLFPPTTSSQSQPSSFVSSSRRRRLLCFPPKHKLEFRVFCSIKEKESIKETKRLNGVPVDKVQRAGSGSEGDSGLESGSGEVGFDWDWPPWKNIPRRYKLIGTTSLAFVICNMDKVNLSIAIIPMSHQLGWSSSEAGLVQSSFFWGYALSQLPGGWLAKIFGGRKVLEIGVLTWSLATALVPLVAGFTPGLVVSRILVGIGEGVSPSAATDLIARSIPLEERSRAVAFVFGGLSVGSVAGLLLAPPLIQNLGWESVFYIFSLLGIGWYVGFQFLEGQASWVGESIPRSQSTDMKKTWSTKELGDSLKDVPWKEFFRNQAVWAMIYAHFCGSWGHYTCLAWLPTYFSEELNLNLTEAAWVSILPPLASIFVTSIASQFADNLISSGVQTTTVRKICQTIAFLSPAACMTLSSLDLGLPHWEVVGILTGGLALSSFALSGLYCTHQDMSPEYASILLGITNTVGAVPGIIGVALTGYLLDSTHSWSISLFIPSIFFYLTGTVIWLVFASSKPQTFSKTD
ncbi:PREDICTED: ascorbate transporter [Prunus dulcis]|uniref:PREDICTED: ascorbate transporter n=1 Tax=Prunus dulcis TaxID=3755 RepID=A0A5E4FCB8_PRUDU|nr:probable anion transporter 6, chloroplastic [Prunus dulcis]VVA25050.1 PREDICTED: ascorbate transporter [Prunus dulcis]